MCCARVSMCLLERVWFNIASADMSSVTSRAFACSRSSTTSIAMASSTPSCLKSRCAMLQARFAKPCRCKVAHYSSTSCALVVALQIRSSPGVPCCKHGLPNPAGPRLLETMTCTSCIHPPLHGKLGVIPALMQHSFVRLHTVTPASALENSGQLQLLTNNCEGSVCGSFVGYRRPACLLRLPIAQTCPKTR